MTDTMRGAVPLPTGTVTHASTPDEQRRTRGTGRVSPIQLAPEPQSTRPQPATRRPAAAKPEAEASTPKPDQRSRPLTHGQAGYNRGCRCEICTVAKREANRRYARSAR